MANPDPQQFAKAMLWHIAGLRADVAEVNSLVTELLELHPDSLPAAFREAQAAKARELQNRLYLAACQEAGLSSDEPDDSTPPSSAPPSPRL